MCQGLDTIRCYRNSSLNLHVFISDVIPGSGCQGVHCCPAGLAIPSGGSSKDSCKSTQNLEHSIVDTFSVMTKICRSWRVNSYSIHSIITFTMEQGESGKLPFFDILLHDKSNRSLNISIHRNPLTRTISYVIIFFYNPWNVKKTMILLSLLQSMKCPSGCEWCNRGRTCQRSPGREWVSRHIVKMLAKPM